MLRTFYRKACEVRTHYVTIHHRELWWKLIGFMRHCYFYVMASEFDWCLNRCLADCLWLCDVHEQQIGGSTGAGRWWMSVHARLASLPSSRVKPSLRRSQWQHESSRCTTAKGRRLVCTTDIYCFDLWVTNKALYKWWFLSYTNSLNRTHVTNCKVGKTSKLTVNWYRLKGFLSLY